MSTTTSIPDQILPTYARGVFAVLHMWPALRIAVQQGWGGNEGRTALAEDIVDLFYTTATEAPASTPATDAVPDQEDIEDVLLHVVTHAFHVLLEDGSEVTIAKDLTALWLECVSRAGQTPPFSDAGLMEKFEAAADKAKAEDGVKQYAVQRGADDDSDDEDDSGDDSDEEMEGVEEAQPAAAAAAGPSRPKEEPEIDEDGFQTVTKKKGGRR